MPSGEQRERRSRGPGKRVGLTRQAVLDHALDYVDRKGLSALTMRALGAEVEAMTLYHYVPTKDALLDGILERGFTLAAPVVDTGGPWRRALHDYAHGLRQGLLRHPGILPLATSRPAATPETLERVEDYLRMLTAAGFELGRALHAVNALTVFVIGHVAAEIQASPTEQPAPSPGRKSASEEAEAGSAEWVSQLDPARLPLLVEAARTGRGVDDGERFAYAVDCFLAGFAQEDAVSGRSS
jgi:AcrR family transcriptional regulator